MTFTDVLGLMAGLGLFLFGMKILSDGLEQAAGSRMRRMLEALTSKRIFGLLVGFLVTAIIQSSSATTVMVVGFVNSGLMSLTQSVGVIMGANIGTTATAWLVALNPKQIAPFAMFLGAAGVMFMQKKSIRNAGMILTGLGLLFIGLNMMSDSLAPLQHSPVFTDLMISFGENPFLGIFAGMLVTAVFQSSSASVAVLQALAMQGVVPINSAIFILFGQNIGTCATALLASIGASKTAKRAAMTHLLFNVIGTAILTAVILIASSFGHPLLATFVSGITDNVSVQIALVHLIFNVVTTAILFPFGGLLVKLACMLVPGEDKAVDAMRLLYIDERLLGTPSFALSQVMQEIGRMAELARQNVTDAFRAVTSKNEALVTGVLEREKLIDFLNHSITAFLVRLNSLERESHDAQLIASLYHVLNDLERIGDHAENIADEATACIERNSLLPEGPRMELDRMYNDTMRVFDMAFEIFSGSDPSPEKAASLNAAEDVVDAAMVTLQGKNIEWLNSQEYPAVEGLMMVKIVTNLERVADHCMNIAIPDQK